MSRPGPTTLYLAALLAGAAGMIGCATETVVDLELVQVVEVAFSQMEGDTQYQAEVALQDLRAEADYVELQPSLRCVGLDPYASNISIVRLLAPALETFLVFQVDIAPHGSDVWTPLAAFEGFVADHEVVPFSDGDFVTYYDGLEILDEHALGDQPSFDLRVTGEVPAAIDDLVLDLTLELDFSTDAGRCPGPAPISG